LVLSLSALCVGCVLSALASSIGVLIAGRVIQGLGGAAVALSFGIVCATWSHRNASPAASASCPRCSR
jgi:MFS family permease